MIKGHYTRKKRELKMNEQNYESEINIGRVFYRILRDWRKLFMIALIVAILLGIGTFIVKRILPHPPAHP